MKKHKGLFRSACAALVLAACVASCDGAAIVAQDGSISVTSRTIRGVVPSRIGNAMVTRINVIDAKTGRTVAFAIPNAQGAFTINNVPKGSTYRITAQAGRIAVPLIFPQAVGSTRKTNLFRIGTKASRAGTLDGPVDVGTITSTTEGQDEQLTPMNPMQAPNNQEDFDQDGMPDAADGDDDGDGTPDDMDTDDDGDGMEDNAQYGDQDGDGVTNESDADMDGDGTPNEDDADNDNDGTPDAMDTSPNGETRGTSEDSDGDGIPNAEDSTEADDGDVDDEAHGDGGAEHEDASAHEDGGGHGHEDVPPDPPFEGCTDTPYEPSNPGPHWSYMDQMEWPSIMGPDGGTPYATCAGPMMQQTPIDLTAPDGGMFTPEENQLTFVNYNDVPLRILNNGHTVQVNVARTGEPCTTSLPHVMIGTTPHCLVQLHGHTQSEHTVGGQRQPMEWHFVHSSTNAIEAGASLAVIGVFFNTPTDGAPNAALASLLERAPRNEVNRTCASANINLGALLPTNRSYYHYSPGSLTTPGCTKGLNWFVLSAPVATASSQTSRLLERIGGHENYRNIQPLGARTIYRYSAP